MRADTECLSHEPFKFLPRNGDADDSADVWAYFVAVVYIGHAFGSYDEISVWFDGLDEERFIDVFADGLLQVGC